MVIHNDFEGLCIGGPLDGQTKRSRWNQFTHQMPLPDPGPTPPAVSMVPPGDMVVDRMQYRHVELWAASTANPDATRYGFWVPDENMAESHRYILGALTRSYYETKAKEKPKRGIHADIAERVGLAQIYAEDGAFMTAGRVLAELADDLVTHAHATSPGRGIKARHKRGKIE